MKNNSVKNGLIFLIIILFIFSLATPLAVGFDSTISEEDKYLGDLTFVCSEVFGFSKLAYFIEHFQKDYSNNVAESKEETISKDLPLATIIGGPMNSPWPIKGHDLHHTGRSPYSTVNTCTEKWRFEMGNWVEGGSVISDDGTIYFGCFDQCLYALYPDGTLKWKHKLGGWIWSTPAIADDGTIYVGTDSSNRLYAIYPNGTEKWSFNAHDTIYSSPAIAGDGTIYFGTMGTGYNVYAVNPNGTEKWHYTTGYKVSSDPAIGDDGTIYIGSGDTYLYALWPNGTLRWRFKTGDWIQGPPSIADDGTIYIGSFDGYLYALYANGTMKWRCGIGPGTETNPSIASEGTIYVGSDRLYAIYPNGTLRWSFYPGADRFIASSSPAVSADGIIYFGTNIGETSGGEIIAVNLDGTERWRKHIADKWVDSSPSIAEDGTVYIGSSYTMSDGYLHAFGTIEDNEPPSAPVITGETSGNAGDSYTYTFVSNDPEGYPVKYFIEWGDNTSTGWTWEYDSGEEVKISHTWSEEGTYTIRAKAMDISNYESGWGTLEVTMPRNKAISNNQQSTNSLFLQILQRILNTR